VHSICEFWTSGLQECKGHIFLNPVGRAPNVGQEQTYKNKFGGLPGGTGSRAQALRPPTPHDGIMTQPTWARPNGISSSPNRICAMSFTCGFITPTMATILTFFKIGQKKRKRLGRIVDWGEKTYYYISWSSVTLHQQENRLLHSLSQLVTIWSYDVPPLFHEAKSFMFYNVQTTY
jgi:hypothetical protein